MTNSLLHLLIQHGWKTQLSSLYWYSRTYGLSPRESVLHMCCHYPCPVLQISALHPFTHSYPFPDPLEVKSKSLTHYHIKFAYLCTALNLATGLSDENLLSLIVTRISFLSEALSLVERYAPQLYGKGYVSLHEPMPVGRPINECFQLFPEHWVLAREHYNLWPQRAHGCPAQSISGKAHKAAG